MGKIRNPDRFMAKIQDAEMFIKIWCIVGGIVVGFMLLVSPLISSCREYGLFFSEELISPCESYIARWYLRMGGGAAGFVDYRGHIIDIATGQSRHVYNASRRWNLTIEWIDETTVMFNETPIDITSRGYRATGNRNLIIAVGTYVLVAVSVCLYVKRLKRVWKTECLLWDRP